MNINQTLERNKDALLKLDGVVAVGIGYKVSNGERTGDIGIIVSVKKKQPDVALKAADVIPKSLDGVRTDVIETGEMRILENVDYMRPAFGGISIGHKDITAGTFGCVVKKDSTRYILSNNHVLANSNAAEIGDAILQPGPHDGGTLDHQIAVLNDFVPIVISGDEDNGELPDLPSECNVGQAAASFLNTFAILFNKATRMKAYIPQPKATVVKTKSTQTSVNYVDAALALPLDDKDIDNRILEIGEPRGIAEAALDMPLKKNGRTTGFTEDVVLQTNVTVNVQYGEGKVAQFADQLMAGPMSAGGDSGSAVLNSEDDIVGLLFAGSDEFTIINRIQRVFDSLNVTL